MLFSQNSDTTVFAPLTNDTAFFQTVIDTINLINPTIKENFHGSHIRITPAQNALNISSATNITVVFNEYSIDASTVNDYSSFIVTGENSGTHRGSFEFNENDDTLIFKPNNPFLKGEIVRVSISNKIKNQAGENIIPIVSQFTIITEPTPGKFSPPTYYATDGRAFRVFVYDLNSDGFGDIVSAVAGRERIFDKSNFITIFMNKGDGTFNPGVNLITDPDTNDSSPMGVYINDLNGDGLGDIAVALTNSKAIAILLNQGSGNFANPVKYPSIERPDDITGYDVDGDGDIDLAYTDMHASTFCVMKNNGDGTFAPLTSYFVGFGAFGIYVYDMDNDGDGDVVTAASETASFKVYFNDGNGNYGNRVNYNTFSVPRDVFVSDLDGDGDGDVVVVNQISQLIDVYKNDGHGTLSERRIYLTPGQGVGGYVSDIDGDGDGDILVAIHYGDHSTVIALYKNRGDGIFSFTDEFPAVIGPVDVIVSDLDNDGDGDIVTPSWPVNNMAVLKNSIPGISGKVFYDENENARYDSGELGIPGRFIQLDGPEGIFYATTNVNGDYYFITGTGTYSVKQIQEENWVQTFPVDETYTVELIVADQEIKDINFGNAARLSHDTDLGVTIDGSILAAGVSCESDVLNYCNGVCTTECVQKLYTVTYYKQSLHGIRGDEDCILTVNLPKGISYINTVNFGRWGTLNCPPTPSGNIFTGITLTWTNLCDLPSSGCNVISRLGLIDGTMFITTQIACCYPTIPPGNEITASAEIITQGDIDNSNNFSSETQNNTGPTDPNNKLLIFPVGRSACEEIIKEDTLTYQINFQNIGTAPARNVVIIDTLDYSDLDVASVKSVQTSHPAEFSLSGRGVLTWKFKDINLPDSTADLEHSVGFVKFQIRPRSDISPGDKITNQAAIYFDYNDPVITNEVINDVAGDSTHKADFSFVRDSCAIPNLFEFNYAGTASADTFRWDFGPNANPRYSTDAKPKGIIFAVTGNNPVRLFATIGNCKFSNTKLINIPEPFPLTIADFSYKRDSCVIPNTFDFMYTGGGKIDAYNWDFGPNAHSWSTNEGNSEGVTFTVTGENTVHLTVRIGTCTFSSSKIINVPVPFPLPVANITYNGSTFFCPEGHVTLTASEAPSHLWSTGDTSRSITVNQTGNYFVTNFNILGCGVKSVNVRVESDANYNVMIFAGSDAGLNCPGDEVQLSAYSERATTFHWSPAEGLSNPDISNPIASPLITTEYTVTGTDPNGCSGTDRVTVFVNNSCGNEKISMCHIYPASDLKNIPLKPKFETICIPAEAKQTHLAHGDYCGICLREPPKRLSKGDTTGSFYFNTYPNPSDDYTNFEFMVTETQEVEIELLNLTGSKMLNLYHGAVQKYEVKTSEITGLNLTNGIYLIRIKTKDEVMYKKLIISK